MRSRSQALKFSLNAAIVVVIEVVNEFGFRSFALYLGDVVELAFEIARVLFAEPVTLPTYRDRIATSEYLTSFVKPPNHKAAIFVVCLYETPPFLVIIVLTDFGTEKGWKRNKTNRKTLVITGFFWFVLLYY